MISTSAKFLFVSEFGFRKGYGLTFNRGKHMFGALCSTNTIYFVCSIWSTVVECQTPEREVGDWKPTSPVLCP